MLQKQRPQGRDSVAKASIKTFGPNGISTDTDRYGWDILDTEVQRVRDDWASYVTIGAPTGGVYEVVQSSEGDRRWWGIRFDHLSMLEVND